MKPTTGPRVAPEARQEPAPEARQEPAPEARQGVPPTVRLGLVLGVSQVLAWAMTFYVPAVATGPVTRELGAGPAAVIGAFSWSLLVSGVCAPRIGRLIERHGGRPVLAAGAVVQAAGLLVLSGVHGLPGWYLGWTVLGVGMAAGLYDAAFATAGRLLGARARPVITGITLIGGFASTLGWPLGAAMMDAVGWRLTLLAYAAVLLGVNLPVALLLVPRIEAPPAGQAAPGPTPAAAATPGFGAYAAFLVLRALVGTTVSVYTPALLMRYGLAPGQAVLIASLIGPAQVGTRLVDLALGRWLTPLAAAWAGAALLPASVVVLFVGLPPVAAATAFVLGYGASNGILTITRGALPLYLWGGQGYATRIGRMATPFLVAQAAAPTLAAPLVSALPASGMFLLFGLVGLLAVGCLAPLRRPPAALAGAPPA